MPCIKRDTFDPDALSGTREKGIQALPQTRWIQGELTFSDDQTLALSSVTKIRPCSEENAPEQPIRCLRR